MPKLTPGPYSAKSPNPGQTPVATFGLGAYVTAPPTATPGDPQAMAEFFAHAANMYPAMLAALKEMDELTRIAKEVPASDLLQRLPLARVEAAHAAVQTIITMEDGRTIGLPPRQAAEA